MHAQLFLMRKKQYLCAVVCCTLSYTYVASKGSLYTEIALCNQVTSLYQPIFLSQEFNDQRLKNRMATIEISLVQRNSLHYEVMQHSF